MGIYLQYLIFTIIGIILLWLGYSMFFGPLSPFYPNFFAWLKLKRDEDLKGLPGDPQVCPVCSLRLIRGELVKSVAYPSITGGMDRLMYIKGCHVCLDSQTNRRCPVCNSKLSSDDFLVSRMFERVGRNNHVHVLGCNLCKRVSSNF